MIFDEDEDARAELGSYQKKKEPKALSPYRYFKAATRHESEPEEMVAKRRQKNLSLIEELKKRADVVKEVGGCFQLRIEGFWFDLYPTSDTWFSHSKNAYGCSIERLKSMIEKKLIHNSP